MLRRIFRSKKGEVTEDWRKLLNELHNLYISSNNIKDNQIKEDEIGGACRTHGGGEKFYKIWV
jgi:transcription termination factor Rho